MPLKLRPSHICMREAAAVAVVVVVVVAVVAVVVAAIPKIQEIFFRC